jgi:membrane protein YqaA with SNARE-associated domain
VVSALVPWINAEVILLAFAATAGSWTELAALVLVTTAGQMLGKCVLYGVARGTSHRRVGRSDDKVERWRRRLATSRRGSLALVFVSSVVGIPPFYIVTMLAGRAVSVSQAS